MFCAGGRSGGSLAFGGVRQSRGRVVLVESLDDFDARLGSGARHLAGWRVVGVDLTGRSEALARCRLGGALFLGCRLRERDEQRVQAAGGLVLPVIADSPVATYRTRLYTPEELYDDPVYARSLDARAYGWSQTPADQEAALAQALHDHAIDDALVRWVAEQRRGRRGRRGRRALVGVMGGHAVERGQPAYAEAARLGHALGQRLVVATGGGPGAMEAASIGATMAAEPVDRLAEAVAVLARAPSFRPSVEAWLAPAREVRAGLADSQVALGVPTWHYGHEPTNLFAGAVAKYFRNAPREAVLLQVCDAGIVFLPGAGGTVQEVFQDACENYYADESSVAPMVLLGRRYWTETMPAWPLLRALAGGRPMAPHVHLADSVEEAAEVVLG